MYHHGKIRFLSLSAFAAFCICSPAVAEIDVPCYKVKFDIVPYRGAVLDNLWVAVSYHTATIIKILTNGEGKIVNDSVDICELAVGPALETTIEVYSASGTSTFVDVNITTVITSSVAMRINLRQP